MLTKLVSTVVLTAFHFIHIGPKIIMSVPFNVTGIRTILYVRIDIRLCIDDVREYFFLNNSTPSSSLLLFLL